MSAIKSRIFSRLHLYTHGTPDRLENTAFQKIPLQVLFHPYEWFRVKVPDKSSRAGIDN